MFGFEVQVQGKTKWSLEPKPRTPKTRCESIGFPASLCILAPPNQNIMNSKNQNLLFAFLNLAGFIAVLILNGLANALPINGKTTGDLSDLYPNLFVPAGFTFSIWGIIYLMLAIFVVYQLVRAFKDNNPEFIGKMGPWFLISCVANATWIVAWHYEQVLLSLGIMLVILVSLIMIYLKLQIGKSTASNPEKYLVHLPFSIYLGWISVATVANVTTLGVDTGWGGFGISEPVWTIIVLIVAAGLALGVIFTRNDIFFPMVTLWAFWGILSKRMMDLNPESGIMTTLYILMVIVFVSMAVQVVRKKVYKA
jgi:hypothetical protein